MTISEKVLRAMYVKSMPHYLTPGFTYYYRIESDNIGQIYYGKKRHIANNGNVLSIGKHYYIRAVVTNGKLLLTHHRNIQETIPFSKFVCVNSRAKSVRTLSHI